MVALWAAVASCCKLAPIAAKAAQMDDRSGSGAWDGGCGESTGEGWSGRQDLKGS